MNGFVCLRWLWSLLPVTFCLASLRGKELENDQQIPGMGQKVWGGYTFDDSPATFNWWSAPKPYPFLRNMNPTAPFDAVDVVHQDKLSGAGPLAPNQAHRMEPPPENMMPMDYVPPYLNPATFPAEKKVHDAHPINIPMGQREMVAYADKIRPYGRLETRVGKNYPLVAPADGTNQGPYPVAYADRVPVQYARFYDQVYDRKVGLEAVTDVDNLFHKVDIDKDGSISAEEYNQEVEGRQKKTTPQAEALWAIYKKDNSADMSEGDFKQLAKTGFDVGQEFIARKDIASIIEAEAGSNLGFWGAGVACPDGHFVNAVRLKVMPLEEGADNSALNAIGLKCDDGTEITSAEGADGTWSDWGECPEGEFVYGFRARAQGYDKSVDNTGVNDLMFQCRSKDMTSMKEVRFGDPQTLAGMDRNAVIANGATSSEGGWSGESTCGNHGLNCGIQVRLRVEQGEEGDDMGITDLRFFCCVSPVDCSTVCRDNQILTPECATCRSRSAPETSSVDVAR